MEPLGAPLVRLNELTKSVEQRLKSAFGRREGDAAVVSASTHDDSTCPRRDAPDPIEILKRLQRESFSDLMKLRDKQDKIERLLTSKISSKGSFFQEARTRLSGLVDVVGALFFAGADAPQNINSLIKAGVNTGIESRFTFQSIVRQKDSVITEFVASNKILSKEDNHNSGSLVLRKIIYTASIYDCLSVLSSPLGAQCKDLAPYSSSLQVCGPSLFSRYHDCAIGLNLKRTNFAAALGALIAENDLHSVPGRSNLSTFGQLSFSLFEDTNVTLSGLLEIPRSPFQKVKIGALSLPIFGANPMRSYEDMQPSRQSMSRRPKEMTSKESVAVMLDAEMDNFSRIGAWIQMQKSNPNQLQWALFLSEEPEESFGWGFRIGGSVEDHINQLNLEGSLKIKLGEGFSLQPGLVYAMHWGNHKPALMMRANWSI